MKRALFPGSFDPITKGHQDIVERGLGLFDEIVVGIGYNTSKPGFYSIEKKLEMVQSVFKGNDKIKVKKFNGLTVDFCKEVEAQFILRGVRTNLDYEYENAIAKMNEKMMPGLETIIYLSRSKYSFVSSSIVREIIKHKGDVSQFVPNQVVALIR
ncbi:MAG: pantetheine-phosphate adenylyltransferase [Sphingobacteriales bacterium]|jgi:pantetheine-phosphate adenylyltransferase